VNKPNTNSSHHLARKNIQENPNSTIDSAISLHTEKRTVSHFTKEVDKLMIYSIMLFTCQLQPDFQASGKKKYFPAKQCFLCLPASINNAVL